MNISLTNSKSAVRKLTGLDDRKYTKMFDITDSMNNALSKQTFQCVIRYLQNILKKRIYWNTSYSNNTIVIKNKKYSDMFPPVAKQIYKSVKKTIKEQAGYTTTQSSKHNQFQSLKTQELTKMIFL